MRKVSILLLSFLGSLIALTSGCNKATNFSTGQLDFSLDTLVFDTVFTTIGSTTQQFKIYNNESKSINIEEIELMGGSNSPFRMNVDGEMGTKLSSMVIESGDSLFAFVEVTLNVNNQNLPLIVEDSIRFRTNGKDQYIHLAVWGQDAYFHYKDLNEGTWPNDKPHVVFGYAAIDSAKTLTIQKNTKIYLHKNALLYNYKGTLNIEGEKDEEVIIQGDRLESLYDDVSGQYYGIYFQEARPSSINYAIIKNGTSGVHLYSKDASSSGYTLTLTNTKITNHARYGVFIYSGAKVKAENCLIKGNGNHALLVKEGGDFNLNFCTLLGYGSSNTNPTVGISNYYSNPSTNVTTIGSINEGSIRNSIITGNQLTELVFDTLSNLGVNLNFSFRNCLIKLEEPIINSFFTNILWNAIPYFTAINDNDFTFLPQSVLNGGADANFWIPFDLNGATRDASNPDIGAYEVN